MARPQKNNADYFPHDADMRNDPKIKALRRKFKHTGYAVWNYILESLADSDFFEIEWSDLNIELLAADFDIEPDELREIVAYSSMLGLLQTDNGILTCEKLKLRFKPLLAKRKPNSNEFPNQKPMKNDVSDIENPQSKVKESKVNNSAPVLAPPDPPEDDDEWEDPEESLRKWEAWRAQREKNDESVHD